MSHTTPDANADTPTSIHSSNMCEHPNCTLATNVRPAKGSSRKDDHCRITSRASRSACRWKLEPDRLEKGYVVCILKPTSANGLHRECHGSRTPVPSRSQTQLRIPFHLLLSPSSQRPAAAPSSLPPLITSRRWTLFLFSVVGRPLSC